MGLATVIYLSGGLASLLSVTADGVANAAPLQIIAFEFVVNLLCAAAMVIFALAQAVNVASF